MTAEEEIQVFNCTVKEVNKLGKEKLTKNN